MSKIQETILHHLQDGRSASLSELSSKILETRRACFVSLILETIPKMRKTGNPYYDKVKKISRIQGIINFDYESSVNRRLLKEGKQADFERSTSWHQPIMVGDKASSLLVNPKTNEKYLKVQIQKQESVYTLNGVEIAKSIIDQYLPAKKSYENQGLDNPVKFISPKLENIKSIAINNEVLNF